MGKIRRYLFIILGLLLTGIGILGIITPVLPTTVFFIMAAAAPMDQSEPSDRAVPESLH